MEKVRHLSPKILGFGIVFIGLIVLGSFSLFGVDPPPLPEEEPGERRSTGAVDAKEITDDDPPLLLVLGVDTKPGDRGRSDTMMVASLDPNGGKINLLSLPRDMWVEIPGRGHTKLNHAFAFGGAQLALETVTQLLDLPIEHFVVIEFQGFEAIVDAVGGVEIDVEKRMYKHDPYQDLLIDLQPGVQRLNGEKALHYARFRDDATADLGRIERQHKFIKALAKAAASPRNLLRIPALVKAAYEAVDTNISLKDSLTYANFAKGIAGLSIMSETVPGKNIEVAGVSYVEPNLPEVRTVAYNSLLGIEPPRDVLQKATRDQEDIQTSLAAARERHRLREAQRQAAEEADDEVLSPTDEEPDSDPDDTPENHDDPIESNPTDPGISEDPDSSEGSSDAGQPNNPDDPADHNAE